MVKRSENIKELDLHGLTQIEAENLLYDFLVEVRENNLSRARIITGYGLNSPSGKSVIRELTKRILIEKGIDYKYLEGKGIFEVKL